MIKFEYNVLEIATSFYEEDGADDYLNRMGLSGWELVSVVSLPLVDFSNTISRVKLYMKRQLPTKDIKCQHV